MKKHLALLLSLLMLAPTLAACGSAEETTETTPAAENDTTAVNEESESELSDDLPSMDFGGTSFVILTSSTTTQHTITAINEQTGDILNDAMYDRTQQIAEKYNIQFQDDYVPGDSDAALDTFSNSILAADQAYDLAMLLERRAFAMTHEGYFTDISQLEHVNLNKPYWMQDINEAINFSDATYLSYGYAQICLYDMTHVLCFNQNMLTDLQLESPFDLVLEGTWTLDKLQEMGQAAARDANGDGAWDDNDIYAIIGGPNALPVNFLASSRQRTIEIDADGNVNINLLTNPLIEEIYSKVASMCWSDGFWYTKTDNSNTYWHTIPLFQDDKVLFADHTFYSIIALRDMVSDFGIVPFPKYTAEQENYGVMVEAGTRALVVPTTAKDPKLCGAVLETLHFLSYRDVMPAYYEVTLKQKVSRDHVSAQMLDLIMDSVCYDLGMTMFCEQIKDGIFTTLFRTNQNTYVSTATTKIPAVEAAIADAMGD